MAAWAFRHHEDHQHYHLETNYSRSFSFSLFFLRVLRKHQVLTRRWRWRWRIGPQHYRRKRWKESRLASHATPRHVTETLMGKQLLWTGSYANPAKSVSSLTSFLHHPTHHLQSLHRCADINHTAGIKRSFYWALHIPLRKRNWGFYDCFFFSLSFFFFFFGDGSKPAFLRVTFWSRSRTASKRAHV